MTFNFRPAVREATPLLIGLTGPSGSGKTKSALRLAQGIQNVRGGKIAALDTEANRMLHYADEHKFIHCPFGTPFGSDRYADALESAAAAAAGGVVIVDSMSHEHEGQGGYLEYHDQEVKRLIESGGFKSEYAASIPAWNKPVARRRNLINRLLQINCAFVFCFRAKEKLKIQKGKDPVALGWQAIAGEEFVFEMTVRCLLLPGAMGVPDWSADAFKLGVPKRASSHEVMFKEGKPLDEETGSLLAQWAAGAALTLAEVKAAYAQATTPEAIAAVDTRAAQLPADEKAAARTARTARLTALKAGQATAEATTI